MRVAPKVARTMGHMCSAVRIDLRGTPLGDKSLRVVSNTVEPHLLKIVDALVAAIEVV